MKLITNIRILAVTALSVQGQYASPASPLTAVEDLSLSSANHDTSSGTLSYLSVRDVMDNQEMGLARRGIPGSINRMQPEPIALPLARRQLNPMRSTSEKTIEHVQRRGMAPARATSPRIREIKLVEELQPRGMMVSPQLLKKNRKVKRSAMMPIS